MAFLFVDSNFFAVVVGGADAVRQASDHGRDIRAISEFAEARLPMSDL